MSVIGTGNMARAIGALAIAGGNTVEVVARDQAKAAAPRPGSSVRSQPGTS